MYDACMSEESSVDATTPEASAPASVDAETPKAATETPKTAEPEAKTSTADKVKAAREAAEGKQPQAKVETPKAEDKKDDDEKEPEGLTEGERNRAAWIKQQRDTQLQESAKLAEDRKAFEAEKAELEKAKTEIAAKQTEKPKEEPKADQPVAAELEHFKPIKLSPYYEDGVESEAPNEVALKAGIEALAKDVQAMKTAQAEIASLKAEVKLLRGLADPFIPDEHGVTPYQMEEAAKYSVEQGVAASEALMEEFGPESGLKLDVVNLMAALEEFGPGFVNIGEIKKDKFLDKDSIIKCWRHANKTEIEVALAKKTGAKKAEAPKPPPVRKSEGGNAKPPSYEQMSSRERMLYNIQKAKAQHAGKN